MLRYVYILIYFHQCFCYEYFDEDQKQFGRRDENGKTRDEDGETRDNKLVQFDLLNFIKNSVTDNVQDYEQGAFRNKKRDNMRTQHEDYYEASVNENIKKKDENNDYFNLRNTDLSDDSNDNDPSWKTLDKVNYDPNESYEENEEKYISNQFNNKQAVKNEKLIDKSLLQNPENKCAFKNMKVPFFSHKESSTKAQTKKLSCLNCAKKFTKDSLKVGVTAKTKLLQQQIKRAYGNVCPECIKKLLNIHRKKQDKVGKVQNSREFYQSVATLATTVDPSQHEPAIDYDLPNDRVKRDGIEERERQLKELAEVENKVDNVKITTPKIAKVPALTGR